MESKSEELSKIMADVVYERLFYLMEHNCMEQVTITLGGAKDLCISSKRKVRWKPPEDEVDVIDWIDMKNGIDPVFGAYGNKRGIYSSVNDMYVEHCNAVMDKISELEKILTKVNKTLERASSIGLVYERKILTEKTLSLD